MTGKRTQKNDENKAASVEAILDTNAKVSSVKYARLPCRGCIVSCKNYHRCNGKLWRMSE